MFQPSADWDLDRVATVRKVLPLSSWQTLLLWCAELRVVYLDARRVDRGTVVLTEKTVGVMAILAVAWALLISAAILGGLSALAEMVFADLATLPRGNPIGKMSLLVVTVLCLTIPSAGFVFLGWRPVSARWRFWAKVVPGVIGSDRVSLCLGLGKHVLGQVDITASLRQIRDGLTPALQLYWAGPSIRMRIQINGRLLQEAVAASRKPS